VVEHRRPLVLEIEGDGVVSIVDLGSPSHLQMLAVLGNPSVQLPSHRLALIPQTVISSHLLIHGASIGGCVADGHVRTVSVVEGLNQSLDLAIPLLEIMFGEVT